MSKNRLIIANIFGIVITIFPLILTIFNLDIAPETRYFDSAGLIILFILGFFYSCIIIYCTYKNKTIPIWTIRGKKHNPPSVASLQLGAAYILFITIFIIYNSTFAILKINFETILLFSLSLVAGVVFLIGGIRNKFTE